MIVQSPYLAVAESVDEALEAKRQRPLSRFIAGGSELIADQNMGLLQPAAYVSLRRVQELQRIQALPTGLQIGAGVVIARLLNDPLTASVPLLRRAARAFGTRQVRNRATVGGNIASGLPNRTLLPCLLALDADIRLQSSRGQRNLALEDILIGPGRTAIADDELLVSVTVSPIHGFQDYTMVGPRNAQFFATASVALVVDVENRKVRLGLGNAGPVAMRSPAAENFANGAIDWDNRQVDAAVAAEFGEIAGANCDPPADAVSGADYRRHAIKVMAKRLLARAFEEVPE